ncbi:hypothetical protein TNCV_2419701 [Trichonephila clavipes]|nr:hypothetical protein TNCV_2419701 [Trichonephila clavipes]
MATVDFLHHENPPTWAGVELATLGTEGQRQTNHDTQPASGKTFTSGFYSLILREDSLKQSRCRLST